MKKIFEHIEKIKDQPHHIRKNIAFGTAGVCTVMIALIWLVGTIGSGTFALKPTSFADAVGGNGTLKISDGSASGGFAGVAATIEDKNAPAHIEIIDTASSTRTTKKPEQTTIPF